MPTQPEIIGKNIQLYVNDLIPSIEALKNREIHENADEKEKLLDQMAKCNQFIRVVEQQRTKNKENVNFNDDPELIKLVDEVRTFAPDLIEEKTYFWKGKEAIDHLIDSIMHFVQILTLQISQRDMKDPQNRQELNQILEIIQEINKSERESNKKYINNIGR